jgi:hypothetical protein
VVLGFLPEKKNSRSEWRKRDVFIPDWTHKQKKKKKKRNIAQIAICIFISMVQGVHVYIYNIYMHLAPGK